MTSEVYKVWDPMGGSEEHHLEITATEPAEAAEFYAAEDVDGGIDGTYAHGHKILVRCPDGSLKTFEVNVEYDPTFYAEEIANVPLTERTK